MRNQQIIKCGIIVHFSTVLFFGIVMLCGCNKPPAETKYQVAGIKLKSFAHTKIPSTVTNWKMLERLRSSDNEPLNFADKYTLLEIGCGAGCVEFCLIDRVTGNVYFGKSFNQDFPNGYNGATGLKYKSGNKLLTVYHATAFNYPIHVDQYAWNGQSFVLAHSEKVEK